MLSLQEELAHQQERLAKAQAQLADAPEKHRLELEEADRNIRDLRPIVVGERELAELPGGTYSLDQVLRVVGDIPASEVELVTYDDALIINRVNFTESPEEFQARRDKVGAKLLGDVLSKNKTRVASFEDLIRQIESRIESINKRILAQEALKRRDEALAEARKLLSPDQLMALGLGGDQ